MSIGYENYKLKAKLSSTRLYKASDIKWTSSDTARALQKVAASIYKL